jgi:ribA/ribD-fused uncharacterized protein
VYEINGYKLSEVMWRIERTPQGIPSFSGEYAWLSNFFPAPQPSLEHHYQVAKTLDEFEKVDVMRAYTPGMAKARGRRVTLRPDWDEVKVDIMYRLLQEKFDMALYPDLATRLLRTNDDLLVEGNTWHDGFWGICTCSRCHGVGRNMLGRLLMVVRMEVRRDWS